MIYASHLIEDEEMERVLEKTGMGLESIWFSVSENLDHLERETKKYRQRLRKMGVMDLTLHGPFLDLNPMTFDTKVQAVVRERFEQAYEAAQNLHAKKIVFHTGFLPNVYFEEGWAERMADFWNGFMEGKKGIQILMENVYDPSPMPIRAVKEMVDSPDFALCLDLGHAHCYSDFPLETWVEELGEYVKHIHVHDNDGTWDHHLGLGRGNLPYKELFPRMQKQIADATFTIECRTEEEIQETWTILHNYWD